MNYNSSNIKELLDLGGGTGDLANLVGTYKKEAARFPAWEPKHPVIILADNDQAGRNVLNGGKKKKQIKNAPALETNKDFFHICNNLYVVLTPLFDNKKETCIEDLYPQEWLNFKLDNKKLTVENGPVGDEFYGKMIFARKVITENFSKIDFSKFTPLLERLVKVIEHFQNSNAR